MADSATKLDRSAEPNPDADSAAAATGATDQDATASPVESRDASGSTEVAGEVAGELSGQPIEPPTRKRERRIRAGEAVAAKRTLLDRIEAFVSRLSTRNNFWHRVCSLIWLPYAFRSGIVMRRLDDQTFQAVLPFRKFNKNWYNAMAGAALLGNSEIAGGMYVFGICGGDYMVVCKKLEYRFLRPCLGPAVYKIKPRDDTDALLESGSEFDIEIQMDIYQAITSPGEKERRVGRAVAVFHATPKLHQRSRGRF